MKYLLLLFVFVSCRDKSPKYIRDQNGKLWEIGKDGWLHDVPTTTYTINDDLTVTKSVDSPITHDTIFFNDRNSVVYLHDTIYKTKIKYSKPNYYYVMCDTNSNIIMDTFKIDTVQ
jgi:hypothetical protein